MGPVSLRYTRLDPDSLRKGPSKTQVSLTSRTGEKGRPPGTSTLDSSPPRPDVPVRVSYLGVWSLMFVYHPSPHRTVGTLRPRGQKGVKPRLSVTSKESRFDETNWKTVVLCQKHVGHKVWRELTILSLKLFYVLKSTNGKINVPEFLFVVVLKGDTHCYILSIETPRFLQIFSLII